MLRALIIRVIAALSLMAVCGQLAAGEEAFPAHRVVGNVYYVGSKALATYLITTPDGHALINSGFEETVPLIRVARSEDRSGRTLAGRIPRREPRVSAFPGGSLGTRTVGGAHPTWI
jgi:hypothetical protein